MKKQTMRSLVALLVLMSLLAGGIWTAAAQQVETGNTGHGLAPGGGAVSRFVAGEVLVKLRAGVSASAVHSLQSQYDAAYVQTLYGSEVELWRVAEGQEQALVEKLNADPAVEYAEPNYIYYAFDAGPAAADVTPNDPHFSKQWAHPMIGSPAAWDISTGSSSVVIAIIDTGIDSGHPDLSAKIVAGYDFVDDDTDPRDENGHGTHVAGIAAASTDNGVGIAGMDWQARIMPVRVLNAEGEGKTSDIVAGINWAYQHGARVLNLSLGGPGDSQAMQDAVTAAHSSGSLVVAAMGNDRVANPTSYPAAYEHVMAVSATGPSDTFASYSQYGPHCDIAAPGGQMAGLYDPKGIYSTMPTYAVYLNTAHGYNQNYDTLQGTSQATPHVSGLAALLWARTPSLTPDQVQERIQDTADDLGPTGWDQDYGWGRINAEAALLVGAVPQSPVLFPILNPGGVGNYVVNWSSVPIATAYTLQEATDAAFSSPSTVYSGANTSFSVTGKAAGSTFYYRVRAANAAGNSPWSSVQSVTMAPPAPTVNAISNPAPSDEYVVSWTTATGATSYALLESSSASCSSPAIRYMGSLTQYEVTGQRGGTWYYCVRASNLGGDSPASAPVSTTVDPPALAAPIMAPIDNADGDGDYLVDWSDVPTTPVTYTLEASDNPYFVEPTEVYTGTASQHQVTDQSGGTHYYRVRAFGQGGRSPWSLPRSATVGTSVFLPLVVRGYGQQGGWQTITSEDFEGTFPGTGWQAFDNGYPPDPSSEYYWDKRDCLPYAGSYSGWAVGDGAVGGGLACMADYPNNAASWLVYGPFSLADATEAELTYQAWVNVPAVGDDQLCHMASIDTDPSDGRDFYGYCTSGGFPQVTWTERTFDLTDVHFLGDLTGEPQVWLALIFRTDAVATKSQGAYVDNIVLRKLVGTSMASAEKQPRHAPGEEPAALTLKR